FAGDATAGSSMTARILVIEHVPTVRELMCLLLQEAGYDVTAAENTAEGLSAMRADHPDLVLCGLRMTVLEGFGVVRSASASPALQDIPIIAITAFAAEADLERIRAAGFKGMITKPIDPAKFVEQVKSFLQNPG